jgi:hypothetical protein
VEEARPGEESLNLRAALSLQRTTSRHPHSRLNSISLVKKLISWILAPVLFVAGLFGSFGPPLGGSNRRPPTNHATLQFEHLLSLPFVARTVCLIGILSVTLACVSAQYGMLAALAVLVALGALFTPSPSRVLRVATTVPIFTDERPGKFLFLPIAAATKIPAGVIACTDAAGRLVNGSDTAGLRIAGRAEETGDNSAGAAGDLSMNVRKGSFKFANSGTNAITAAMVGKIAYIEDNQTVASTTTNKIAAGRILGIDADLGVWVAIGYAASGSFIDNSGGTASATLAAGVGVMTVSLPLVLSKLGNADVLTAYVPGYAFKILSATVAVTSPVTTAAKAATLTPKITGVAITGGVVALTSANCTPLGALVAGTAVTALNTGAATDSITITGSAVTAFVEGEAVLLLKLQNLDTANAVASLAAA